MTPHNSSPDPIAASASEAGASGGRSWAKTASPSAPAKATHRGAQTHPARPRCSPKRIPGPEQKFAAADGCEKRTNADARAPPQEAAAAAERETMAAMASLRRFLSPAFYQASAAEFGAMVRTKDIQGNI